MSTILPEALSVLFLERAPPAIEYLPNLWPSSTYDTTNLGFIVKLSAEGLDILDSGDSLVKSFDFTRDHPLKIQTIHRQIVRKLQDGALDNPTAELCRDLPQLMLAIATYNQQRIEACKVELIRVRRLLENDKARHDLCWNNQDFDGLLTFYPQAAMLYDEDGELQQHTDHTHSLTRTFMAQTFKKLANSTDGLGAALITTLGPSPVLQEHQKRINYLPRSVKRNTEILLAIQNLAQKIEDLFFPPALKTTPVCDITTARFEKETTQDQGPGTPNSPKPQIRTIDQFMLK